MKKYCIFLLLFSSCLVTFLSLLFVIIEGRLLFSGDWLLYERPWIGGIQYLLRFLMAIGTGFFGIHSVKKIKSYRTRR